jgi:hypothetical protein
VGDEMNFLLKAGAKAFLKSNNKTKIIVGIASTAFFLLIMPVVPAMAAVGPIIGFAENVSEFTDKANNFFQTTGEQFSNFFAGRGFTTINTDKVKEQEDKVYDKLESKNNEFSSHVQLDLPLIAATVFYPMNFVYDEKTIERLNNMNGTTENQVSNEDAETEAYENLYDYYKKVRRDDAFHTSYITLLANNSISEIATTYKCEARTITDKDGNEMTYYVTTDQISTTGPQKFDGSFKDNESCKKGVDSVVVYNYQNDPERYDKYLREEHIPNNAAYDPLFEGLDDTARASKLDAVVSDIHGLRGLYADSLGIGQVIAGYYSNLCTTGIIVSGGNRTDLGQGVYNFEDYVAGVVSAENAYQDPKDPNNLEAMKAQAIAVRTYTLARTNSCTSSIRNGTEDQVFNPNASQRAKEAVRQTAGMVLTYNGKIFSSEYDAYYCTEVAVCLAGGTCSCEYTKLPNGEKHTVSMPKDAIQYGGGGHGRGMSQELADYMQTEGYKYDQILQYFYSPGVQIVQTGGAENGTDGMITVASGKFYIPSGVNSGLPDSKGSGPSGFNIYFWQRLSAFFAAAKNEAGYTISYTDAWRSYDGQVKCQDEKGSLCATPGTSMHGWGIAADLDYKGIEAAQKWALANAGRFNLKFPLCPNSHGICTEPWHIEPVEIIYK